MTPMQSILLACNHSFSTQTYWGKSVTLQWICSYPGVECDALIQWQKPESLIEIALSVILIVPLRERNMLHWFFPHFLKIFVSMLLKSENISTFYTLHSKAKWRTQQTFKPPLKTAAEWFLHNIRMCPGCDILCSRANCNLYKSFCSHILNWSTSSKPNIKKRE